jgi:hypothetical protein
MTASMIVRCNGLPSMCRSTAKHVPSGTSAM